MIYENIIYTYYSFYLLVKVSLLQFKINGYAYRLSPKTFILQLDNNQIEKIFFCYNSKKKNKNIHHETGKKLLVEQIMAIVL